MDATQANGRSLYEFKGRLKVEQFELLRVILWHERIPFSVSTQEDYVCIEIEPGYAVSAREVVQKWYETMHLIHAESWRL